MDTLQFITAGKAIFTVKNMETANRFTYKAYKPEHKPWFYLYLLNGTDNESNYAFIGSFTLEKGYRHSPKSKIGNKAQSVMVIEWYLRNLLAKTLPPKIETYHEGRCGRCGRKLTVPESIKSGFGPECVKTVFKNHVDVMSYV